jgi:hypothetical protein
VIRVRTESFRHDHSVRLVSHGISILPWPGVCMSVKHDRAEHFSTYYALTADLETKISNMSTSMILLLAGARSSLVA